MENKNEATIILDVEPKKRWNKKGKTPEEIELHNKEIREKYKDTVKQTYKMKKERECIEIVEYYDTLRDMLGKDLPELVLPVDIKEVTVLKLKALAFTNLCMVFADEI